MPLHKYYMTLHKYHMTTCLVSGLRLKSLLQRGNQTMKLTSPQRFEVTLAPKLVNFMYKYAKRYVHVF